MTDLLIFPLWIVFALALAGLHDLPAHLITIWRKRMPKTYGPDTVPEVPRTEFDLRVVHEDPETGEKVIRTHHFTAAPDPSAGDFHRFALAAKKGGGDLLICLGQVLPRMIVNDDGVPAQWKYAELPKAVVRDELPAGLDDGTGSGLQVLGTMDAEPVIHFRGPDGKIYPERERKRFEDFEAGSSRRRLYALMFEDDNAKVEMQTVAAIMQDLFAIAGKGRGSD